MGAHNHGQKTHKSVVAAGIVVVLMVASAFVAPLASAASLVITTGQLSSTLGNAPTYVSQWGSSGAGSGQFDLPCGITTDTAGNYLVGDMLNHRIQKFSSNGTYISQFGTYGNGDGVSEFDRPCGIAVDADGMIYVADSRNGRIQKYDSNYNFVTEWGNTGSGPLQFSNPLYLAIDSNGDLLVSDRDNNRIERYDTDGNLIDIWGSVGSANGQFAAPHQIALDSQGNVFIVDQDNYRIQKFDSNGNFIEAWGTAGTGDGQFNYPYSIAIAEDDSIYVADDSNRIQQFTSDGSFVAAWGSTGSADSQFDVPYSMSVDPNDNLFVVDQNNNRIQKFMYLDNVGMVASVAGALPARVELAQGTDLDYFNSVAPDTYSGVNYSLGLAGYSFATRTVGGSETIQTFFATDLTPDKVNVYRYSQNGDSAALASGVTVTTTTRDGVNGLLVTYTAVDGGAYDDDGVANGKIIDYIGLVPIASDGGGTDTGTGGGDNGNNSGAGSGTTSDSDNSSDGGLASTGARIGLYGIIAVVLISAGVFVARRSL